MQVGLLICLTFFKNILLYCTLTKQADFLYSCTWRLLYTWWILDVGTWLSPAASISLGEAVHAYLEHDYFPIKLPIADLI